jgi:hypothetical protein
MKKNYTNSDIFNSYIEIAEKEGLVSLAEEESNDSSSSKKALEKNPRADSLTKERIAKLYNLKPDAPKNMSYDRNIIERAHPKSVIIAPAYDKINGLVENNNERQDIILRIVDKRTNGLLTQHKYAQEEMVRSLVRIANNMDNRDEEELRVLADECLEQLVKEADFSWEDILKGEDVPSWARPVVSALRIDAPAAAVGALLGAMFGTVAGPVGTAIGAGEGALLGVKAGFVLGPLISIIYGISPTVKNISENCDYVLKTSAEMQAALPANQLIKEINEKTSELKPIAKEYQTHASEIESLTRKKEVSQADLAPYTEIISKLNAKIEEVKDIYSQYIKDYRSISNDYFNAKNIGDTGRSLRHWFAPLYSDLEPPLALKDAINSLKSAIEDYDAKRQKGAADFFAKSRESAEKAGKEMKNKLDSLKEKISPEDSVDEDEFFASLASASTNKKYARKMVKIITKK